MKYFHKHSFIIPILSSLLLFSCKNEDKIKDNNVSFNEKVIYTQLYGNEIDEKVGDTKLRADKELTFYYYLNFEDEKIYSHNLKTNELIHTIDVSSIDKNIVFDKMIQIQWLEEDRIGIFSNNDQKIYIVDLEGNVINLASTASEEMEEPSFVSVSFFDRTFSYHNNKVYLKIAYTDFVLNSKENFKRYFAREMMLSIDFSSGERKYFLKSPASYQEGNSYGSYDIFSCINEKGQPVFSFPSSDSVYVFNEEILVKKLYAGSREQPRFIPEDVSQSKNLAYSRKYSATKPFYQKIVFDSYRNLYYRVFKLKNPYLNEDGTVVRPDQYSWSIIVLDKDLEVIGESIFYTYKNSPAIVFPVKEGLIISQKMDKGRVENYTLFDVVLN